MNTGNIAEQPATVVVAARRKVIKQETVTVGAGASVSLSPPAGAASALIQPDGSATRVRLDGISPTVATGLKLDDGEKLLIDTELGDVRVFSAGATSIAIIYYDKR